MRHFYTFARSSFLRTKVDDIFRVFFGRFLCRYSITKSNQIPKEALRSNPLVFFLLSLRQGHSSSSTFQPTIIPALGGGLLNCGAAQYQPLYRTIYIYIFFPQRYKQHSRHPQAIYGIFSPACLSLVTSLHRICGIVHWFCTFILCEENGTFWATGVEHLNPIIGRIAVPFWGQIT